MVREWDKEVPSTRTDPEEEVAVAACEAVKASGKGLLGRRPLEHPHLHRLCRTINR